jgi:hypothetical protein
VAKNIIPNEKKTLSITLANVPQTRSKTLVLKNTTKTKTKTKTKQTNKQNQMTGNKKNEGRFPQVLSLQSLAGLSTTDDSQSVTLDNLNPPIVSSQSPNFSILRIVSTDVHLL